MNITYKATVISDVYLSATVLIILVLDLLLTKNKGRKWLRFIRVLGCRPQHYRHFLKTIDC